MNIIQIILILIVAFLAGMEGVLDQWQFHQPLVACTLIGIIAGQLQVGVILGGMLQLIAMGWANIGAAISPDVALASVASAIILTKSHMGKAGIGISVAFAVIISLLGLLLTKIVRTLSDKIVAKMDIAAKNADWRKIDHLQYEAAAMQGCRIMIPALIMLLIPTSAYLLLAKLPTWLITGLAVSTSMVAAVGFAVIVNLMSTKETWPFFAIGFCLAAVTNLTFIALAFLAIASALIYLALDQKINGAVLDSKTLEE